jgi:hypothetical protein
MKSDSYKKKMPKVRISKSMDKYKDQVLFPEKVAEANRTLKKVGLPDTYKLSKKSE